LEKDANEVGDGILGFLGQFLGFGLLLGGRLGSVSAQLAPGSRKSPQKSWQQG